MAVEPREPRGFGRVRVRIPDASAATLGAVLSDNVEPGSWVVTDGWAGYRSIGRLDYIHEPRGPRAHLFRKFDNPTLPVPRGRVGVEQMARFAYPLNDQDPLFPR